ncbi:MAG: homoserine dehydrogenase [Candidatus Glassbacteria bacterium]|nr:homoserine dehydrogenase [Candidatus Glassbacteria bacterium]
MSEKLKVGLLGYGTIGSGVIKLLTGSGLDIAGEVELVKVADIDLGRKREVEVDPKLLTTDTESVVRDPEINVIIELIGGIGAAKKYVEMALELGKDVITANKYLMSAHGDELFKLAAKSGASLLFEASVAGGMPIIKILREELSADEIYSINAILNGTCNYILTRMEQQPGLSCKQAVAEAQARGFAEADPTLDISGMDTAQKLSILVRKAFRTRVLPEEIDVNGITELANVDVRTAGEMRYRIKLIARASKEQGKLTVWVGPALIPADSIMAQVKNEFNAVMINSMAHHEHTYIGKGAGMMPTAGAVVSDLYALLSKGRIRTCFAEPRLDLPVLNRDQVSCRFYLRLTVVDQPGVLATVSKALAERKISIASVLQKETGEAPERGVPLLITTHETTVGRIADAVRTIDADPITLEPARILRIMDVL